MKRLLVCLLALAILFSLAALAGCEEEKGSPDPNTNQTGEGITEKEEEGIADGNAEQETEEERMQRLEDSLPNEYVPEKLEVGIEVSVAHASYMKDDSFSALIATGIQQWCEEKGLNYMESNANNDMAMQMQQIENFATMGVAAIAAIVQNEDSFASMTEVCESQGTYFVLMNSPKIRVSGAAMVDSPAIGTACSEMAITWLDQQYPEAGAGEIHAMLLDNSRNPNNIARMDAMKAKIGEDPRVEIVYTKDEVVTIDGGFTAAEEAMTYDPSIRLALCFNISQATGINNYFIAQPDLNLEEFGVFCTGYDNNTQMLVELSGSGGESVLRGTIGQGGDNPGISACMAIEALLFDGEQPQVNVWEPLWTWNSVGYEFEMYPDWKPE